MGSGGGTINIQWEKKLKNIGFENYLRNNFEKIKQKNVSDSFIDKFEIDENTSIDTNHKYSITNVMMIMYI